MCIRDSSEVVYCEQYRNPSGLDLLREVGITVRQYVPELVV